MLASVGLGGFPESFLFGQNSEKERKMTTGQKTAKGEVTWQGEWFGEEGEQRDAYGRGSPDPPEC